MQILKTADNFVTSKTHSCNRCGSLLKYERNDIKIEEVWGPHPKFGTSVYDYPSNTLLYTKVWIDCPVCENQAAQGRYLLDGFAKNPFLNNTSRPSGSYSLGLG